MPCRDYYDEDIKIEYKDSPETIEELCNLRSLIIELATKYDIDHPKLKLIRQKQLEHRYEDKKRFLMKKREEIEKIENKIQKIYKLGGIPNKIITDELEKLIKEYNQVDEITNEDDILSKKYF